MSPRRPAVLRESGGQDLREHLIATAARLIGQRGTAGLAVRDIAREAQVADGVLYNYFEDKEDLLAHALLAHVATVMGGAPPLPEAGAGTVAGNLASFIDTGLAVLTRVIPAFAGLLSQQKVLTRFRAMVGGDEAFGLSSEPGGHSPGEQAARERAADPAGARPGPPGPAGLPALLSDYLRQEQRLGRIALDADVEAVTTLVIGAIHGEVLPRVLFSPPGTPVTLAPGLGARLAATVMSGIAPPR